jgi:hypothetical protein
MSEDDLKYMSPPPGWEAVSDGQYMRDISDKRIILVTRRAPSEAQWEGFLHEDNSYPALVATGTASSVESACAAAVKWALTVPLGQIKNTAAPDDIF